MLLREPPRGEAVHLLPCLCRSEERTAGPIAAKGITAKGIAEGHHPGCQRCTIAEASRMRYS